MSGAIEDPVKRSGNCGITKAAGIMTNMNNAMTLEFCLRISTLSPLVSASESIGTAVIAKAEESDTVIIINLFEFTANIAYRSDRVA